ncbi:MAG TPA: FG-GAP-like repeat-containing protein [Gaiellaceae bacterium]
MAKTFLVCIGVALTIGVTSGSATSPLSFSRPATYPTEDSPNAVAIGDLDGDGKPDLVSANAEGNSVSVLLNAGHGRFRPKQDYGTGDGPRSVAIGDVNGDGKADIVVAADDGDSISVLLNAGHGKFAPKTSYRTGSGPFSVALGDVTGDGKLDVATANFGDYTASVLVNDGNGRFAQRRDYEIKEAWAVALADLNGDKKADLEVTGVTGVFVLLNTGDGKFGAPRSYTTEAASYTLAAGDVNGDGKPDLVTGNADHGAISVLLNKGDGTFGAPQGYATGKTVSSVAIADLNGDGKPDLVTADDQIDSISVLPSTGGGTFGAAVDYRTGASPGALALGDLNGDGKTDVATTSTGDALAVVLNTTGAKQTAPRIAHANGTIVFATNRTGNLEVDSIRADGSRLGQLTRNRVQDTDPSFSPDGRHIAFIRASGRGPELWVMNADGNRQRKLGLTEEGGVAWSPDSRRIAFQGAFVYSKDAFPIVSVGLDGRRRVVVPRGRNHAPTWAPDGKRLAYLREVGDRYDLMVAGADGGGMRTVRRNIDDVPPVWSPTSNLIAFSDKGLNVIGPDGHGLRKRAWRADMYAWSRDGRRIAFVSAWRLYVVPATGGTVRDITPDGVGRLGFPAWSPDGRWLAVRSFAPADPPNGTADLVVVASDGSSLKRVAIGQSYPFSADNQAPVWRPRHATAARLGPPPVPLSPSESISKKTALQSVGAITGLAADGGHVAVLVGSAPSDCSHVTIWAPGSRAIHLGRQLPTCTSEYFKAGGTVALAGEHVAWLEFQTFSGNTESGDEYVTKVATTTSPAAIGELPEQAASKGPGGDGDGFASGTNMWYVHGGGDLLVFNTWAFCEVKDKACKAGTTWGNNRITDERLWRIEGERRVQVRAGGGALTVSDVDAGRIAVVEPGGGAVDVLSADGTLVTRVVPSGAALSAQISGSQLAVLTTTGLLTYDVATGARQATLPLSSSTKRALTGFDAGVAVYLEGRTVHVVRLADGHQFTLAPKGKGAVFAQLDPVGLFTGYTLRSGSRPGRVDLMSHAALLRKLG